MARVLWGSLPAIVLLPVDPGVVLEQADQLLAGRHRLSGQRAKTTALPEGGVAIMPPGAMFGYTEEETVIQLHGVGPWGIEYVNPEDDPRGS